MRKLSLGIILLFLTEICLADDTFENLIKIKKTSYLDFILLKIENRLVQRHALMGPQMIPVRVQFQKVASQVDFIIKDSKILISIIGVMNKQRYEEKKYKPNIIDCNILRNILMYGKQGYNIIFKKRNNYLKDSDMENIFIDRYLNNLSISDEEKIFIMQNTFARVQILDPVRGNDILCTGKIAEELN